MNKMITLHLLRNTVLVAWLAGCVAVGPACAQTDQEWEREQQQRRLLREAGITAAAGSPMRFSLLRAAVHDADEHDEDQDAIRYATMMYTHAGPGTRDRAEAAALLAEALEAPDDSYKATAKVTALLNEAAAILHPLVRRKSARDDVVLLGEVLTRQSSRSVAGQRRPTQRERVALYTAHLSSTDPVLLRARRNLALNLHAAGQMAEAEREMRAVIAALPPTAPPAPQFMHELAWMLIGSNQDEAAARYIAAQLPAIDGARHSALSNDTRYLLWLLARRRGDWKAARDQATAMAQVRPTEFHYRATLMSVEAERALGNVSVAATHVATLRRELASGARGAAPKCVTSPSKALWQGAMERALFAIEQQELQCTPR